ncbi:hypothetical protein F2Q69_00030226 [Brassica cretica]|uniref:Aspartic peptidase DDI1-type domain-containing protein n=1 Tax=Brassica cretica TaxID=69181 RepID=A0A8S9S752_BRACR|nr:hypothetical protein F2Q69_00030226 [Brassica cretica]
MGDMMIYFPMDLSISALTAKVEVIRGELVEIQSYIARRPEAALSIDRRNNISTDIHNRTSVDNATNRGRLVPKMTSDMSNTPYHREDISADTYAALTRHQFNLESLGERLQRIENTTAAMKDKWRSGDEAMRDFTENTFTRNRKKTRTRLSRSNQRTSWSLRSDRALTEARSLGVGVENGYDEVNIQIPAKYEYVFPQQIILGQENVATPATVRSEYDDQNTDEPSSGITQLPHMHAVRSLQPVRTPSDDGEDPMEEDRVSTGRTLGRRKEKVVKHLKRGANDKEKESFRKRVFRIPIDKPFEDAYYTHRLFFRETREKEEDIRRMFCEAREKMRMRITLKKKSDPGKFAIPCTVKGIEFPYALCDTAASVSILPRVMADHLGLQVEPSQELFTFVDCSQKNSGGIVGDLEVQIDIGMVTEQDALSEMFPDLMGAVCKLQTNQFCLTLIDPNVHYDPIQVKTPQTISRRINDPGIIAACHCGNEYETEYSASIETHTATSIDSGHQKSTDIPHDESVDSSPDDWENNYYNPIMAVNDAPAENPDDLYDEERLNMKIRD